MIRSFIVLCPSGIFQYCTAMSGISNLGSDQLGRRPWSISWIHLVYVWTASSSRYPTKRWVILGETRYDRNMPLKKTPWAPRIMVFMNQPGSDIFIKVKRCMRSLKLSRNDVSISDCTERASFEPRLHTSLPVAFRSSHCRASCAAGYQDDEACRRPCPGLE